MNKKSPKSKLKVTENTPAPKTEFDDQQGKFEEFVATSAAFFKNADVKNRSFFLLRTPWLFEVIQRFLAGEVSMDTSYNFDMVSELDCEMPLTNNSDLKLPKNFGFYSDGDGDFYPAVIRKGDIDYTTRLGDDTFHFQECKDYSDETFVSLSSLESALNGGRELEQLQQNLRYARGKADTKFMALSLSGKKGEYKVVITSKLDPLFREECVLDKKLVKQLVDICKGKIDEYYA